MNKRSKFIAIASAFIAIVALASLKLRLPSESSHGERVYRAPFAPTNLESHANVPPGMTLDGGQNGSLIAER